MGFVFFYFNGVSFWMAGLLHEIRFFWCRLVAILPASTFPGSQQSSQHDGNGNESWWWPSSHRLVPETQEVCRQNTTVNCVSLAKWHLDFKNLWVKLVYVLEKHLGRRVGVKDIWPVQTSHVVRCIRSGPFSQLRGGAGLVEDVPGNYMVAGANQVPPFISTHLCGIAWHSQAVTSAESGKCVKWKSSKLPSSRLAFVSAFVDFPQTAQGQQEVGLCSFITPFTPLLLVPGCEQGGGNGESKNAFPFFAWSHT